MAHKKKAITFPRGGVLPAAIVGGDKDKTIPPHEPVRVPSDYGQSLIDDKFAVEAVAKSEKAPDKKKTSNDDGTKPPNLTALKAAVTKAKKAVEGAKTDESKAKAEDYLSTAEQALAAATGNS